MKFIKGAMIGSLVATGIFMAYSDSENSTRKRIMKKGKQFAKKIGIM